MPEYDGGIYAAKQIKAYTDRNGNNVYVLAFDDKLKEKYGTPMAYVIESEDMIELRWLEKRQTVCRKAIGLSSKV